MTTIISPPRVVPADSGRVSVVLVNPPTRNINYPPASLAVLSANLAQVGVQHCVLDASADLRDYVFTYEVFKELVEEELPRLCLLCSAYPDVVSRVRRLQNGLLRLDSDGVLIEVEDTKVQFQRRRYGEILCAERSFSRTEEFQEALRMTHSYVELAVWTLLQQYPATWDGPVCRFLESMVSTIDALSPDNVAFTTISPQRNATLLIARYVKDRIGCNIIVGGSDPSRFPSGYLQYGDIFNHVYVGKCGERAISLLSEPDRFDDGVYSEDRRRRGVATSAGDGGVLTEPEELSFDSFPLNKYVYPVLPIATSRGCSWRRCDFCDHWRGTPHQIVYDPDLVAQQMKSLAERYGTSMFHFTDDEVEPGHGQRLFRSISNHFPSARILTYARASNECTREVLEWAYAGGVRVIEWGIESGSQPLLVKMNKGIEIAHVRRLLADAASIGIVSKLMMFHNHPYETVDDLKASLDFLDDLVDRRQIRPFFPIFTRFQLRRDTPMYRRAAQGGVLRKIWAPDEDMEISALYADQPDVYAKKVQMLETFSEKASRIMRDRRVVSTDDESLFLDLVVLQLKEAGQDVLLNLL